MFHEEVSVLANGIEGELITVPTANPDSFYQLISETARMPLTEIYGKLFMPEGGGPFPLVIVVPGSAGVVPSHIYKAELLTPGGIAALVIDPFGTRGVVSTVSNQAQYTFAASAWDVLAAAALMAEHPRVDEKRIGIQGHSRGGAAVLSAATIARRVDGCIQPAGVYGAYPWSGQQFLNPEVGGTIVRSIVGDQDEWCLPQQIQGHMQAMRLAGANASFRLVVGAHHSFDRFTPVEMVEEASVSPGAPTVYIDDDGTLIDPRTSIPDVTLTERDLMLYSVKSGHGHRGARLGTEGGYADIFHDDMMAFWHEVLLPGEVR